MSDKNKNSMSVKQTLKCEIHSPQKWQEDYNGSYPEDSNALPSYDPINVHIVDEYPACPNNWMHGSDMASSYFAGLKEDKAIWLDFNECFNHTHDVAIVLSVQGINPITGQTMIGDNPLRMEQYHKKCPVHESSFKQNYFCEECGFNWPGQNYISTTGTPFGRFWIDGFRTPEGNVRQYIITAEKMKGVAAQIMKNSEDRVFAIGMAFYLSKKKKPEIAKYERKPQEYQQSNNKDSTFSFPPMFFSPMHRPHNWNNMTNNTFFSSSSSVSCNNVSRGNSLSNDNIASNKVLIASNLNNRQGDMDMSCFDAFDKEKTEEAESVKKLEVGAGALVNQRIYDDPKNLKEYWEEKPAGMIYLNYCDEETLKSILDCGRKGTKKDGFMKNIKVGS